MEPEELLAHARDVCDRLGLTYLVVGSTATIAYGEPRFTNDIDIVIDLPATQLDEFCAGFPAADFYISESAAADAIRRKAQFNVIHPVSGLKIDFIVLSDSPFDLSRRGRRRDLPVLEEGPTWFASPEDVVLKKLVYFKEGGSDKHLRDIAGVLQMQAEKFDREYVAKWAVELEVSDVWQQVAGDHQAE